jgi:hypothetical protein
MVNTIVTECLPVTFCTRGSGAFERRCVFVAASGRRLWAQRTGGPPVFLRGTVLTADKGINAQSADF